MLYFSQIYVLAVGVNNTLKEGISLQKTKEDVEHFCEHIKERFPDGDITTLIANEASCQKIKKNIEQLADKISLKKDDESLFVFYYSGHGTTTSKIKITGSLTTTSTLVTNDAIYKNNKLTGGLPLGSKEEQNSLLGMVSKISIRKIIILDTCCGCASNQISKKPSQKKGILKGIKLFQDNERGNILKDMPDLLPKDCQIISACDMNERAAEGSKGRYITNAFLEAVSRDYYPPECDPENIWFVENDISLDKSDVVDLNKVIENVNERLKELKINQNSHIISFTHNSKFLRLLDRHLSLKYTLDNDNIGFNHPPVPDKTIRVNDVNRVQVKIKNKNISAFVVYGPELTGKTTVVALACKALCYTKWDNNKNIKNSSRPLAWVSLEKRLPLSLEEGSTPSYVLPFICYHMDTTPDGSEHQLASFAYHKDNNGKTDYSKIVELFENS